MRVHRIDEPFEGWAGESPYFLVINTDEPKASWVVDVDEFAWHGQQPELMRAESEWLLVAKVATDSAPTFPGNHPIMAIRVTPGEQPYYVKRWVGVAYPAGGQIPIYGIGKKRLDGHVDRLWVLPNGIIVPGDDGDLIAVRILKAMAEKATEEAAAAQQGEGP